MHNAIQDRTKKIFTTLPFFLLLPIIIACENNDTTESAEIIRPAKIIVVGDPFAGIQRVYPGEVEAGDRSEQSFRVRGELVKLPAKAGARVQKNELLAQIDPADFQLRVDEQQARYDLTKVQYDRTEKLVKQQLIPVSDFDKAKTNMLSAKADLRLTKANLSYTELRAPFDGIISKVNVKNHESIRQQQTVLVIQTIDDIEVTFNMSENVISKLKRNSKNNAHPKVIFDTYPGMSYDTVVKEFDFEADPQTRTYKVTLSLPSPKEFNALPGMSVNVHIDFSELVDTSGAKLIIPIEAVFSPEDTNLKTKSYMVWKVDTETMQTHKTPVEIGPVNSLGLEIKSGIESGDSIITAGVNFIKEGQKVKAWIKESGL